jgi:hypothetical protein
MKRLPSCSISVSVSESRSAMISGQEPKRPSTAMRSPSAAFSTSAPARGRCRVARRVGRRHDPSHSLIAPMRLPFSLPPPPPFGAVSRWGWGVAADWWCVGSRGARDGPCVAARRAAGGCERRHDRGPGRRPGTGGDLDFRRGVDRTAPYRLRALGFVLAPGAAPELVSRLRSHGPRRTRSFVRRHANTYGPGVRALELRCPHGIAAVVSQTGLQHDALRASSLLMVDGLRPSLRATGQEKSKLIGPQ